MRFPTSPRARSTGSQPGARSADARPSLARRVVSGLATALVAVLVGGGLAVVGVAAPASAHTGKSSADCRELKTNYTSYPSTTKVVVTVTDVAAGTTETLFDGQFNARDFVKTYPFADETKAWKWDVRVDSPDDPDPYGNAKGWDRHDSGTTTPCAAPKIELAASACTVEGGSTDLTATVSGTGGRVYDVVLTRDGTQIGDSQEVTGSGTVTWADQEPNAEYTVTATDRKDPYTTFTATATAGECPGIGGISVEPQPCLAPGDDTSLLFSMEGLEVGREYELIVRSGEETVSQVTITAEAESVQQEVTVPAGSTGLVGQLYIVDEATGLHSPIGEPTASVDAGTCPVVVDEPVVTVEACTLGATDSDATITLSGLAEGREYQLVVDGAASGEPFTADASGSRTETRAMTPGDHTVSLVDTAAPDVEQPSVAVSVEACPAVPALALDVAQCAAPGGPAGFTATLSGLVPTREYALVVTSGETVVDAVAVTGVSEDEYSWEDVPAGATYTVTVTDVAEPEATATVDAVLAECPPAPGLSATSSQCTTENGTSTITTTISDLAPDRSFTVSLQRDANGSWVTIDSVTGVTSASTPPSFVVPAPADATYRVTVADAAGEFTAETLVSVAACSGELGGGENPPGGSGGVPSIPAGGTGGLANTGSDSTLPAAGGILALVFGLGFIGYSILRRRMASGT